MLTAADSVTSLKVKGTTTIAASETRQFEGKPVLQADTVGCVVSLYVMTGKVPLCHKMKVKGTTTSCQCQQ